ncbi:hypothetical protein N183_12095 [Sinorhizobium sp. Sb3]|uniref:hypothetical protein n=1 Tax=Sinorhizobium sp. Sb3 TaxID=1358417 RepID=UPI00071C5FB8|nr:hypothetical protein [Sinorhizobium sp. Sb3]KSV84560.1 hypothetical protein N183_12095 [Sinorhizobium sp. Sb3]
MNRRTILKGGFALAATSHTNVATADIAPAVATTTENPKLIAAYGRFLAARAEVADAEAALEWLVDEWRHLWPLAPEEILGAANANEYSEAAERDIAGRIIVRDTSDLTKRLSRKYREEHPLLCFNIDAADKLGVAIDRLEKLDTGGRTPIGRARRIAEREKLIREYSHKKLLAEQYEAETARLREASGVEQARQRIKAAKADLEQVFNDVSYQPAYTISGLRLKAEVLDADELAAYLRDKRGTLGRMARFIYAALDVAGRDDGALSEQFPFAGHCFEHVL